MIKNGQSDKTAVSIAFFVCYLGLYCVSILTFRWNLPSVIQIQYSVLCLIELKKRDLDYLLY